MSLKITNYIHNALYSNPLQIILATDLVLFCIHAGIADLCKVNITLKNVVKWIDLGLALGLLYPTLQKIDSTKRGEVDGCKRRCWQLGCSNRTMSVGLVPHPGECCKQLSGELERT